jgi:hypothetical protein
VELNEVERVAALFYQNDEKEYKKKRKLARAYGKRNLFFTSRCFLMFHLSQSFIFWIIAIIFPLISYSDCASGFIWMSHIAIGLYMILIFVFDFVFFL